MNNPKCRILASFGALCLLSASALAGGVNTIEVTTTTDGLNEFDGQCSLREAIHNVRLSLQFSPLAGECPAGSTTLTNQIILQSGATYSLTVPGSGADQGDLLMSVDEVSEAPDLSIVANGETAATIQQTVAGQRVLRVSNAWVEIENVVITGGSVIGGMSGGGIANEAGTVVLLQSVVTANSAATGGGISNSGELLLIDSNLTNNQAPNGIGGALHNQGGQVDIHGGLILGNSAAGGGGIYNQGTGSRVEVEDVDFQFNSSLSNLSGGGASFNTLGLMIIRNTRFLTNSALNGGAGGALYVTGGGITRVDVHDSLFQGNQADNGQGGAIWYDAANGLIIKNSQLIANSAQEGGAIYLTGSHFVDITDSLVKDNFASGSGGAFLVRGARALRTHFENNESINSSGGAIFAELFNRLVASTFVNNRAAIDGGAIRQANFADGSSDNLFQNNRAGMNGGAVWASVAVNSARMRFIDNHSTNGHGGAVYLSSSTGSNRIMSQSLFHLNSAINGQGGALWLRMTNAGFTLVNSTVTGNSASPESGGGIYVHADTTGAGSVESINNTIAGNLAGQDIVKMGNMSLANTIIASSDQDNCITPISNPLFETLGHNLSNDDSCNGLDLDLNDLINTEPLLGTLANHTSPMPTIDLQPGSPAIDAGDDAICAAEPVNGVDQRGGLRPVEGCDIGAHEQEFIFDVIFRDRFELN